MKISGRLTLLPALLCLAVTSYGQEGRDMSGAGALDRMLLPLRPDAALPPVLSPALLWSTYLGGTLSDNCFGVAADRDGSVYVTGQTSSTDFPTSPGAFQRTANGGGDCFVAKLDGRGQNMIWCTLLGGGSADAGVAIAVDPKSGDVVVVGRTESTNFPVVGKPFQRTKAPGTTADMFIARLSPEGTPEWITYYGGSDGDFPSAVAVDGNGEILVAGRTASTDFPIRTGAFQGKNAGQRDGTVVRLSTGGSPRWSTYFGGSGDDAVRGIAFDVDGGAVIVGHSSSTDLPMRAASQPANAGDRDAFVAKLDTGGTLRWSTYFGGKLQDEAWGVACAPDGLIAITGYTAGGGFPVTNPIFNESFAGGTSDAFLALVHLVERVVILTTLFGGSGNESGSGIAYGDQGVAIVGTTTSTDLPISHPTLQERPGENGDLFIMALPTDRAPFSSYFGGSGVDNGAAVASPGGWRFAVAGSSSSKDYPMLSPLQKSLRGDPPATDGIVTMIDLDADTVASAVTQSGVEKREEIRIITGSDRLTIELSLDVASRVTCELFSIDGRRISRPVEDRFVEPGIHRFPVGMDLPPGAYLLDVRAGERRMVRRVVWGR